MKFQLDINIPSLKTPIKHSDKIMLIGSCFTEHIANRLSQHGFRTLSNPNGIMFTPLGVANNIQGYLHQKQYEKSDLFYLNELWNSWDHHTRFSDIDIHTALENINQEQRQGSEMMQEADWLIITLGSAFQYYLQKENRAVSNNHRAPSAWFEKKLLGVGEMLDAMTEIINLARQKNPKLKVIFTVSPVRHIRDGLVENNWSKARMIDTVQTLCSNVSDIYYFPAYELVMDVLRDYRYFDIDFAHPNYAATAYVWERFASAFIEPAASPIMKELAEINTARNHKTRFPETDAHKAFCEKYLAKTKALNAQFSFLDLSETIAYFEQSVIAPK